MITSNFRTTKRVDDRISLILRKIHEPFYYLCLFHTHPDSSAATRTRLDSYSPRAFVSSHSRKPANTQTERSVAATSAVLVTESKLGSGYLFCYVTAENWNITIRLNFIAICGIILLISIVFLKSIPNNNMNL